MKMVMKDNLEKCEVCGVKGLDALGGWKSKKYPKMHIYYLSKVEFWLCPRHHWHCIRLFTKLSKKNKTCRQIEIMLINWCGRQKKVKS